MYMMILSWLFWDPPRDALTIPYFDITVAWYGILFAAGFVIGYYLFLPILRKEFATNPLFMTKDQSVKQDLPLLAGSFAEKLTWFVVLGTIIGARLGHVLFYDWSYYSQNPLEILMIRKGGLASHGGTLGVMVGLLLFLYREKKTFPKMTFISLMDLLVIPTAVTVCFIRIANFFNQEILGYPTQQPWGIIFGHPADGSCPVPRHPVQLYEAIGYLVTFIVLYTWWKVRGPSLKSGALSGLFFLLVFGSRFLFEYLKEPQSPLDHLGLQLGQYLSIPFILLGIALLGKGLSASCPPQKETK